MMMEQINSEQRERERKKRALLANNGTTTSGSRGCGGSKHTVVNNNKSIEFVKMSRTRNKKYFVRCYAKKKKIKWRIGKKTTTTTTMMMMMTCQTSKSCFSLVGLNLEIESINY